MNPTKKGLAISGMLASTLVTAQLAAHSGGLDKNGCHAGSQPYHCHGGTSGGYVGRRILGLDATRDMECKDFNNLQEAQIFY